MGDRGREFVRKALDGDMVSFAELVRKYQDALQAVAFHATGNFEDAREVVQDTFVTV